jgi:hypothetical protein
MEQVNHTSGQIEVISPYGRVYIYTHTSAAKLVAEVHEVLSRRKRWDDPDYLTRMIVCGIIPKDQWNSEFGYGIGTQLYVDVNLLISIDTTNQTISISSYGSGVDDVKMELEDFIQNFYKQANFD